MWFSSFFTLEKSPCCRSRPKRKRTWQPAAATRLTVDALEDRTVPSFLAPVSYALGAPPANLAMADFNKDGVSDLVTASPADSVLSVFLGKRDGSFQPARNTTVANIGPLAVGDFNNDGRADVVWGPSVLLSNGDGTFQAPKTFNLPKGELPNFLAVGDFNNDGKLDLAVGGYVTQGGSGGGHGCRLWCNGGGGGGGGSTPFVNVLLGQGDGSFRTKTTVQGVGTILVVGDFNRDGNLDILAPGMTLLLGVGDGTLQKPTAAAGAAGAGTGPWAVADITADGRLDILAVALDGNGNNMLSLFLGNGNGTFQALQTISAGISPSAAAMGDFNRDGKFDIVATDWANGTVSILLGNGDGTFQAAQTLSVGANPNPVAVGDFNGDGRLDLVLGVVDYDGSNPRLSVLLNDAHW
jgi:hypothetical protein